MAGVHRENMRKLCQSPIQKNRAVLNQRKRPHPAFQAIFANQPTSEYASQQKRNNTNCTGDHAYVCDRDTKPSLRRWIQQKVRCLFQHERIAEAKNQYVYNDWDDTRLQKIGANRAEE